MTGAAFGVQRIPSTLPDIVFALFTGLNAATVGLVALAAYQLSNKVVTDQATRILLLASGAIASCYESQWLYPVLMVAGGATTLVVDRLTLYRAKQILQRSTNSTSAVPPFTPSVQVEEVKMQLPRPAAPVATKFSSAATDDQPVQTTATLRRGFSDRSPSIERYPTPPLEERDTSRSVSEAEQVETEQEEEVYFRLTVKQGLFVCVDRFLFAVIWPRLTLDLLRVEPGHSSQSSLLC